MEKDSYSGTRAETLILVTVLSSPHVHDPFQASLFVGLLISP
jgi:hypothetical protein